MDRSTLPLLLNVTQNIKRIRQIFMPFVSIGLTFFLCRTIKIVYVLINVLLLTLRERYFLPYFQALNVK